MHKDVSSGYLFFLITPLFDFGIYFAGSENRYSSKSLQGDQTIFEIVIAGNDRKCKAHESLP